jgi:hypothetical protein
VLPTPLPGDANRVSCRLLGPVSVRVRMKLWFYLRLQIQLCHHLRNSITDRRHSQRPRTSAISFLGDLHPSHRSRKVTARGHPIPDLVQVLLQILVKICDRFPVYSCRSLVRLYPLVRLPYLPLGFLPSHRDDRFPRSVHEPGSSSRRLYAGHRPGSKQAPPGLVLGFWSPPVLMPSARFRHLFSGSLPLVSLNLTCHDLLP